MSKKIFSATWLVCAALGLFSLAGVTAHAADGVLKLEAQLVVGSNDPQTKGTPVSPQIEKKLKRLPLKWGNYYVVSSQQFSVAKDESKPLVMGGSEMTVKNLGGERVELTLISRGKITQSLAKGHTLVTNVKDENSFVVLRQAD
jgi:hypothetical protein